jgi:probable HAF family extracellular repeat protein
MRNISCAILLTAVAGCSNETQVTQPRQELAQVAVVQYEVTKYPSLGGTQSRGMAINNDGSLVAGWSNLSNGTRRAALWRNGSIDSLPTLGGPSSTLAWPGLNQSGMVVGISHTNEVDPLDESWSCEEAGFLPGEPTNLICRGFVWENGVMRELPPLGGNHSFGTGVNNHGLVVGWAETPVHDSTCSPLSAQVLQFRAVIWDPKDGSNGKIKARELRPFGNDATSAATAINDQGLAVGISGDCDQAVGRFSARHAVLWDKNGKPSEIPNLGGAAWHTPMYINQQGDVVGFGNPAGTSDPGAFNAKAFLWTYGASSVTNLGTLEGDTLSQAFAINSRGQAVGISFSGSNGPRAFLWETDSLKNLNDLVDISPDTLLSAQHINDAGQITGRVHDGVTGEVLMFVATPIAGNP